MSSFDGIQLVDSHCHVSAEASVGVCVQEQRVVRCVMSTSAYDWASVKQCSAACLGVHPWYCHLFSLRPGTSKEEHYRAVLQSKDKEELARMVHRLPEPVGLDDYMEREVAQNRGKLVCIGEIGLDRVFRLPQNGFLQSYGAEMRLSNVRVDFRHQVQVFEKMLRWAQRLGVPVSIHAVKCQGTVFDVCKSMLLEKDGGPGHVTVNVCLHSYTGSVDTMKLWVSSFPRGAVYFGVSAWINLKDPAAGIEMLRHIPLECILSETDCSVDTVPVEDQIRMLEHVVEAVAEAHELSRNGAERQLYKNYQRFIDQR